MWTKRPLAEGPDPMTTTLAVVDDADVLRRLSQLGRPAGRGIANVQVQVPMAPRADPA